MFASFYGFNLKKKTNTEFRIKAPNELWGATLARLTPEGSTRARVKGSGGRWKGERRAQLPTSVTRRNRKKAASVFFFFFNGDV